MIFLILIQLAVAAPVGPPKGCAPIHKEYLGFQIHTREFCQIPIGNGAHLLCFQTHFHVAPEFLGLSAVEEYGPNWNIKNPPGTLVGPFYPCRKCSVPEIKNYARCQHADSYPQAVDSPKSGDDPWKAKVQKAVQ